MSVATTKERPIIFSAPMVRAILAGAKAQTRRVVKPQPELWRCQVPGMEDIGGLSWKGQCFETDASPGNPPRHANRIEELCPYGLPGGTLWCRETWGRKEYREYDPSGAFSTTTGEFGICYRAGGGGERGEPDDGWKSPLFMPRWASRITLRIEAVRVERLGDISTTDAFAEGIEVADRECPKAWECQTDVWPGIGAFRDELSNAAGGRPWMECHCVRERFGKSWDSINGRKPACSWADSPWVWALTFSVVSSGEAR